MLNPIAANEQRHLQENSGQPTGERLLPIAEVLRRCGYRSRSTLYRLAKVGLFPDARVIGPRRIGWLESDVNAFVLGRLARPSSCTSAIQGVR